MMVKTSMIKMQSMLKNTENYSLFSAMGLAFAIPCSSTLTYIALAACIISTVYTHNIKAYFQESWQHPISQAFILFFMLFVLAAFYSEGSPQDILQQLRKMSKLLCLPLLMPLMKDSSARNKVMMSFIAGMILTLFLSLLKLHAGLPLWTRHTEACIFKNHIETNLMMALAVFFLGHYALDLPNNLSNNLFRYCLFFIIALMIYYIIGLSEGRAGYIIFFSLWILFLIQRFSWKKICLGLMLLSIVITTIGLGSRHFRERMVAIAENIIAYQHGDRQGGNSLGVRLEYSVSSAKLGLASPVVGSGTGSFKAAYRAYAEKFKLQSTDNPHNEYMNIFVQLGFVGLAGLLMLLLRILNYSFALKPPHRYFAQGLLLAFALGSLANSWWMDFTPGHLFVVLFAVSLGEKTFEYKKSKVQGISVIVTTYNWPQALKSVLRALEQQSYSPFEVIIADDGSSEETRQLIEDFKKTCTFPLKHIWQEDLGFRAAAIRNKALRAAKYEYIVFLDGDCLPRPHFLYHQARLAEKSYFVVGNRVLLNKQFTQHLLTQNLLVHDWSLFRWCIAWLQGTSNHFIAFFSLPLGPLRKLFPHRWKGAKGCNLAAWKQDLKSINGWEEQFQGWGYEDSDLVIRLLKTGIQRKSGRFAIPVIHLWHAENDRAQESKNLQRLMQTFQGGQYLANLDLDQYSES